MADLHDRWVAERRNEHYYKLAKKLNYRSRASFTSLGTQSLTSAHVRGDGVRLRRSAHGPTGRSSAST